MILPLEKQVPTRETCERLRDAGFPEGTRLEWCLHQWNYEWVAGSESLKGEAIPAPTAAELGALLPSVLLINGRAHHFSSNDLVNEFGVQYSHVSVDEEYEDEHLCCATNEAEARALLWLDLHAKGLLPDAAYGAEVNG